MLKKRTLKMPKDSFFLFGPRATGKTTWLKEQVNPDQYIDLLKSESFLRFSKHPQELSELITANPKWRCIIIDEIQKVPQLLDEVHSIIFESKNKIQFILIGSSARKLKRNNVNLLAGRALLRKFHPFTAFELGKSFKLQDSLEFGMLPRSWNLKSAEEKKDYLFSYVETYLREEIQQEALTRNLPAYSLFLEHMALRNAQVINLQNLSTQIGVARTTLKGYLEILEDTLIGISLHPIQLKAKVKEVATPKFYFFDTGVVRGLSNSLDDSIDSIKGSLLETYVLHELMCYSDYHSKRWQFNYWSTPGETEVDFIISSGRTSIGIEVKSSSHWSKDCNYGLNVLLNEKKIKKAYGIYTGKEFIKKDNTLVIPIHLLSKYLTKNSLF
ncbi:MAG: ATP-binding protein [Oligoflexia bacterium]|nr:ATP-binding protein [Oligoflexia bacterium]